MIWEVLAMIWQMPFCELCERLSFTQMVIPQTSASFTVEFSPNFDLRKGFFMGKLARFQILKIPNCQSLMLPSRRYPRI
jgi:hypothetical protein